MFPWSRTPIFRFLPALPPFSIERVPHFLSTVLGRLVALALLYIVELVAISIWLDNEALAGASGLAGFMHIWGAWILRSVVGFAALFVTCVFLKNACLLAEISAGVERAPIRRDLLLFHFGAIAIFGGFSYVLYAGGFHGGSADALACGWLAAGTVGIVLGAFAFIPWRAWERLAKGTGFLWLYVLVGVACACVLGNAIRSLWSPAARLTFSLVHVALIPFLSGVVADPSKMSIGTSRFVVEIAPECSGLEGIGLILAFTAVWLVLFRKECRFPNALVLLPAGVAIMFLLNAARIAGLVLLGNAGAERIALGGFHSQAGWIVFNAVALVLAVGARRVAWVIAPVAAGGSYIAAAPHTAENPTAAYLLPFLAILAAGMASTAVSAGFEWLYPLRFFAAGAALWYFRKQYAGLGWKCTWVAPAAGVLVFVLWVALDRAANPPGNAMPAALAGASIPVRDLWIAFRVLAAVVTVPIAEELAFRAYAMRRLMSADFESVSLRRFTWVALVASSVLFGALHGTRWFAGTLAGLVYGAAMVRRGRIADAVVAHATTNALLAAYVITCGKWGFW
jgi:exosortase E/protease (VPEID-CTERM system)